MKLYRAVWYGVCSLLTVFGAGVAVVLWSPSLLAFTALGGAAVGGAMTLAYLHSEAGPQRTGRGSAASPADASADPASADASSVDPSSAASWRRVWRRVAKVSPASAIGAVCIGGWASVLGALVPPVLVLVAGSSPYAVWRCRKALHPSPRDESGTAARMPARVQKRSVPASTAVSSQSRAPGSLTDAELCRAWRRSFSLLLASPSPSSRMRIVEARQRYLDEFERRNPDGLSAWLESGPRAAEDPRRYLA